MNSIPSTFLLRFWWNIIWKTCLSCLVFVSEVRAIGTNPDNPSAEKVHVSPDYGPCPCPHCMRSQGQVNIGKVDVTENKKLGKRFGIKVSRSVEYIDRFGTCVCFRPERKVLIYGMKRNSFRPLVGTLLMHSPTPSENYSRCLNGHLPRYFARLEVLI